MTCLHRVVNDDATFNFTIAHTVKNVIDVIGQQIVDNGGVQFVGVFSIEVKERAAHEGRNPKTKEEIKIPASRVPVFKAGKAFKDAVDK